MQIGTVEGLGHYIVLRHDLPGGVSLSLKGPTTDHVISLYANLQPHGQGLELGAQVSKGQKIGSIGAGGLANGAGPEGFLHFGLKLGAENAFTGGGLIDGWVEPVSFIDSYATLADAPQELPSTGTLEQTDTNGSFVEVEVVTDRAVSTLKINSADQFEWRSTLTSFAKDGSLESYGILYDSGHLEITQFQESRPVQTLTRAASQAEGWDVLIVDYDVKGQVDDVEFLIL